MSGIVDDLRSGVNDLLGIRDSIGAALKEVWIVTRTWSGIELGDGTAFETREQMLPSPRVVEFKTDLRIKEGGAVQSGDIMLKMVSRQSFPNQADVDFSGIASNVEKLYEVGGRLYRPVGVTEKHLTWTILLRPLSDQKRYPNV